MLFYLGTHQPDWLAKLRVPLFISRRRLCHRHQLPRANVPWALDSGAFTELRDHGRWTLSPHEYVAECRRYRDGIGKLTWCAPMDWCCEPLVLAQTGLSVGEHQARTVANYLELQALALELPWIPVLQGWHFHDYLNCLEHYQAAGVDLAIVPCVGVGSLCRRQATGMATALLRHLALGERLRLHAFGFKLQGLAHAASYLTSADSLAWSRGARYEPALPGCTHAHCANCLRYALAWRERVLLAIASACPAERWLIP